jgi:ABC-2 type transport system ATP-binding protein
MKGAAVREAEQMDGGRKSDQQKPVIQVRSLTKKFGDFTAVDHISFQIPQGEILGLLGPNGAGKTTTIKMIIGLLRITSGDVFIKNLNIKKKLRKIKTFIGYMSQKFSLYPLLNSYENMEFFGGVSGLSSSEIRWHRQEISMQVPERILKQKVMDIPPGIKQQVALYTCLMPDPEIIFLDEPTSGVDPENRRNFWMQIYHLKRIGKTVLVTTHNLDEAEYADRVIIIHKGHIIREGEPSALMERDGVDSMETLFKQAIDIHETP